VRPGAPEVVEFDFDAVGGCDFHVRVPTVPMMTDIPDGTVEDQEREFYG
jgi:hypothetical protein